MNALPLALAICAFVFGLISLVGSLACIATVIGWKSSTHQVVQLGPQPPTEYQYDQPQSEIDRLPLAPGTERDPSVSPPAESFYQSEDAW